MKALGLVVSDKKIFESCILKTYFLTPWPTYATNWNGLNNFDRGPPRDHSCEVWSKSNKQFQRRCCFKKLLTHGRTHARTDGRTTDDGRRTLKDHKSSLEHFVLRWAKKTFVLPYFFPLIFPTYMVRFIFQMIWCGIVDLFLIHNCKSSSSKLKTYATVYFFAYKTALRLLKPGTRKPFSDGIRSRMITFGTLYEN